MSEQRVLVIGMGDVGQALLEILKNHYECHTRDIEPLNVDQPFDVIHICYPFQIRDFVNTTVKYIEQYCPNLVCIHSTIVPGTSRQIFEHCKKRVVYTPVRGKHNGMKQDIIRYTKYLAGSDDGATLAASAHLQKAGIRTGTFSSFEALELAKLIETTYFGLLIAWAQETERFCRQVSADYYEVMKFTHEIDYLPPVVFRPGFIGGHCVIPNTELLTRVRQSDFLEILRRSNQEKAKEVRSQEGSLLTQISPVNVDRNPRS